LAHLALYYQTSPEQLDTEQVKNYLNYCKNQHDTPSDSFFKHTVYGLRAAYKCLGIKDKRIALPQLKRQDKLPIILNTDEVKQLLKAPKYLRHRLMLAFLYGCGMRSYELCNLEIKHLDFKRKQVLIPKGKGKKDRYVPLSEHLIRGLKKLFKTENNTKYVFISQVSKDGKQHPITNRTVQWLIKECRAKVDTVKPFTAHTLRHSYATHLLEQGTSLPQLKALLGHSHIETTMIYLHVAQFENKSAFSPLDSLYHDKA